MPDPTAHISALFRVAMIDAYIPMEIPARPPLPAPAAPFRRGWPNRCRGDTGMAQMFLMLTVTALAALPSVKLFVGVV